MRIANTLLQGLNTHIHLARFLFVHTNDLELEMPLWFRGSESSISDCQNCNSIGILYSLETFLNQRKITISDL